MDQAALQAAREAIATGQFPQAAASLEKLCRSFPQHGEAAHALALSYAQMGMLDRAIPAFERAATLAPSDPALRVNFGAALSRAGRGADAVRELREAVRLDPNLGGAHYNLAHALALMADHEGAAHHFREAARIFPDAPTFWRDLGRAESNLNRWDAAIEAYRHAADEEDSCHLDAKQELALALESAGREVEAIAAWQKLVAVAPLLPIARNHLVSLLARSNRLDEAEAVALAGTEASPTHADFHHSLGTLRSMRGDAPGAVAAFRRALLHDPARVETALSAEATVETPLDPDPRLEHAQPFGEAEHRIGILAFRIHSGDDLSRALAHALPSLLADLAAPAPGVEVRYVAAFQHGTGRRADIAFDWLAPESSRMAELTKSHKVERWIWGEIAPDLATLRIRTWTAGTAAGQDRDFPLNPADPLASFPGVAEFARITWPQNAPPSALPTLHYALGATSIVDELAFEHLLTALDPAPFPLAEAELIRALVPLLERGEAAEALGWIERGLSKRPSARLFFVKGQALYQAQNFDAAQAAWAEAAKLDSTLATPPLPAGWLALKARNVELAESKFREAAATESDAAAALVGLGVCALAKRDGTGARKLFLEALEKSPRLPEAIFQTSLSWWLEGNRVEAERWAGRLEQHHEGHALVQALAKMMGKP